MRYVLAGATAAMALVGAATIGNAQAPDDKGKAPAAEGKAPASDGKATQGEPGAGKAEKSQKPAPNRAAEPRSDAKQSGPKAEGRDERSSKGAEKNQGKDQPKSTKQQPAKDQPKSTEAPTQGKDQPKATQQQPGKDQPKSTESPPQGMGQQKSTQGTDQKQGSRVQVTEQQRSGVREQLVKQGKVEKIKINVTVNIGTTIPRSTRLHILPVAVYGLAPAYRGYSYIVLEDETICIIDAQTYTIIDVIPVGSQRADRPARAQLALSAEQMRFVFASVPKDRTADVRVRLGLGAEVPRNVELLAFPGEVSGRVPELGRYRYVVTGSDVVIVDPNDHAVVLVINE